MQINVLSVSWVQPGDAPLGRGLAPALGMMTVEVWWLVCKGDPRPSPASSLSLHTWGFGVLHGPGIVSFQVCYLLRVYLYILFFRVVETTWHFQGGENSMVIDWNNDISIASVFVSLFNLFHHLLSFVPFTTFITHTCLQLPPIYSWLSNFCY